jgi:hypothetical protein
VDPRSRDAEATLSAPSCCGSCLAGSAFAISLPWSAPDTFGDCFRSSSRSGPSADADDVLLPPAALDGRSPPAGRGAALTPPPPPWPPEAGTPDPGRPEVSRADAGRSGPGPATGAAACCGGVAAGSSLAGAVTPAAAARLAAGGAAAGAAGSSGRMGTGGRPSLASCGGAVVRIQGAAVPCTLYQHFIAHGGH